MPLDCNALREHVSRFSLVGECDVIANGMLRFSTPFQYPDGSNIDLFLGEGKAPYHKLVLTDLGQTTANLLDLHIKPWATKKRKQVIADICRTLDVEHEGGEFKVTFDDLKSLPGLIIRLSQACIRAGDLMFTQRLQSPVVFRDDLEEFISAWNLPYEPNVEIVGQFGRPVPVDFSVNGAHTKSLVLAASTGSAAASRPVTNEIFRKWNDLENVRQHFQFLSIYDSKNNYFRDDDLARLETISTVLAFPAQEQVLEAALAA
jgi:hypothetical protein